MAEGVPITAAEASDLGCSHLSPSVGGSGPFLPRSLPCPTLCSPQPLGRWMVRSRIPGLGRGESVLGEGPGVRPCTGSDSQRPPNVSLREGLGGRVDTRGRRWLLFQHQARDRTGGTGTVGSQNSS